MIIHAVEESKHIVEAFLGYQTDKYKYREQYED